MSPQPPQLSYVVPLRWETDRGLSGLARYLADIARVAEVIVVDGSPPEAFDRHRDTFSEGVRQLRPDPDLSFRMGKVNGVITGARAASHEHVVVADDDVRYDARALEQVRRRLAHAHLVVPQNHFASLPWHARLDTARTLLNRLATGDAWFRAGDFPGTLGFRRGFFLEIDAYDGDLIFENLELMRTVRAAGGEVDVALDLFVARLPPDTGHFLSQRIRQAYDDFAIPLRMAFFLTAAPLAISLAARRRWWALSLAAAGSVGWAELGRRRAGGAAVYPWTSSLLAPAWMLERALCAWLAVGQRLFRGGTAYGGARITRSATSARELVHRYRAREDHVSA